MAVSNRRAVAGADLLLLAGLQIMPKKRREGRREGALIGPGIDQGKDTQALVGRGTIVTGRYGLGTSPGRVTVKG